MYLFHNNPKKRIITFVAVTTCTTNAGTTGLNNYERYNSKGCAVVKTNQWYYDLWSFGYHRGKMPALKQVGDILVYRDYNKNQKKTFFLSEKHRFKASYCQKSVFFNR